MFRLLLFCLAAIGLPLMAQACDMRTEARAERVADYVEQGRLCLQAAPEGFRYSTQMERAFVRKINEERTTRGLKPLIVRMEMQPAARYHSLDMGLNGFFGHKTPRGRTSSFRISAFDRTMLAKSTAENVAQLVMSCNDGRGNKVDCSELPASANDLMAGAVDKLHADLMESEGHRANILAPDTTHIALGVARTDTSVYVTQLFARPVGQLDQPLPLRLKAGSRVDARATLDGFQFKRFALMRGGAVDDLMTGIIPAATQGDLDLAARGETVNRSSRAGQMIESLSFIYLPGPSVSILPPDAVTGS